MLFLTPAFYRLSETPTPPNSSTPHKKRGCEIPPTTPVEQPLVVIVRCHVDGTATAAAECEMVARDAIFHSPALLAPLRPHFLHPRHRCTATANEPESLLAEDSWI